MIHSNVFRIVSLPLPYRYKVRVFWLLGIGLIGKVDANGHCQSPMDSMRNLFKVEIYLQPKIHCGLSKKVHPEGFGNVLLSLKSLDT